MVPLVQLVRASDCGSECHGFESHRAPQEVSDESSGLLFCARRDENPGFVIDEVDDGYDIHPTLERKKDKKKKKA